MRFSDKLFLATTALLTVIFMAFGSWLLSSNFSQLLDKEIERGNSESRMFAFLFEMGYRSMEEFGGDYAVSRTLDSITDSVERDGSRLFVLKEDGSYFAGEDYAVRGGFDGEIGSLADSMARAGNTYGYCIRRFEDAYYMFTVTVTTAAQNPLYLGLCRELTPIYENRQNLLRQYRTALLGLLAVGSIGIYGLSRYITRPIRSLDRVAKQIADGRMELRSSNKSGDEIGELARNFNRMADRLVEQAEAKALEAKQKEDFTAAFAHELKTPLTSIIGYADMMNSMKISEEERAEATFYIYSQGKRLESLSYKLLELVSMDKNPLENRPIQTKLLEENIRATVRPIWAQKNIHGKVDMDKGMILGDMELLLSLLYNLLDNAAKAMDKGERGFIWLKGKNLEDGRYEIKVVDNGRGIPQEEISRITEAFYMVDKSRSRREGGAGIGMALCHKIIKLHDGVLKIDSKLGEGTVMKVVFPAVLPKKERTDERKKKAKQA
ncbi:MAG: HAMP domain-containing histidine kinase [Blautia sp.]|nr:HAMP domain-containing histidine kinase [Blautia sp.]